MQDTRTELNGTQKDPAEAIQKGPLFAARFQPQQGQRCKSKGWDMRLPNIFPGALANAMLCDRITDLQPLHAHTPA